MLKLVLLLILFWVMQAAAALSFKYGTNGGKENKKRWIGGYLLGNCIGMTSMIPNMIVYGILVENTNVAAALMSGGSFIGNQIALFLVFRNKLSPVQFIGILLASAGLILTSLAMPEV